MCTHVSHSQKKQKQKQMKLEQNKDEMCGGLAQCKHYGLGGCGIRRADNRQWTVKKNMVFTYSNPTLTSHIAPRSHSTLILECCKCSPSFTSSKSGHYRLFFFSFLFPFVWWSSNADSSVFVFINQAVNTSCVVF